VLWTLNATQDSGGTVVGSFVYDAATNLYSNIGITTTVPTGTFDTSDIAPLFGAPSPTRLTLVDGFVAGANAGKPVIFLEFNPALTNLGGSVNIAGSLDGLCIQANCIGIGLGIGDTQVGGFISGNVSGTPVAASAVPEPATLFLCGSGLAGLRRWRQHRV
jgi:hypothetical protein